MKRKIALLVTAALLFGILPMERFSVGNAVEKAAVDVPADQVKTENETDPEGGGYGLHNPRTDENGYMTWDCVYFGNYWQADRNGDEKADQNDEKQPIKWWVLSVDGDDAFLLADKDLDAQPYNASRNHETDVTWETCTLRSWLNGYGAETNKEKKDYSSNNFLNNAFSEVEQSAIRTTFVENKDNDYSGAEGGNDTWDKVYLLSLDEVVNPEYGFVEDDHYVYSAGGKNTRYATAQGASTGIYSRDDGSWWLRSPGVESGFVSCVDGYGSIDHHGWGANSDHESVRPALHLNLKKLSDAGSSLHWSHAGTFNAREETALNSEYGLHNPTGGRSGSVGTWDCVYFGKYWQNDTNGDGKVDQYDEKQPIKWRVLSGEGDEVFLLSDKILDCQKYNEINTDVTWKECTIRSWLNGYGAEKNKRGKDYRSDNFIDSAFSPEEQSAICITNVINEYTYGGGDNFDEYYHVTEGYHDTLDQVYLLSEGEHGNYGYVGEGICAQNTEYAKAKGAWTNFDTDYEGNGYWWYRTPGYQSSNAACVSDSGEKDLEGFAVNYNIVGVRPVLRLNLKALSDAGLSSSWSYAGTVTSDRKANGTTVPTPAGTAKPSGAPTAIPTTNPPGSLSPAESKKPDEGSTAKPAVTPTPVGTVVPVGSPSPAESKRPDEGSTADPTAAPNETSTASPDGNSTAIPDGTPTKTPDRTPNSPGTTLSQPDQVLQPTAAPVPDSIGREPSVGRVSAVKLKQKKQTVTVSWKKVSEADGYQICYSTSKKWKKKTQKLTANMKVEIKRLKKKKTYYFRVRAYRKDGSRKVYGAWSSTRKIRIRK